MRLASELYQARTGDLDSAAEAICGAIGSLRPIGRVDLLQDTISQAYQLVKHPEVQQVWKAEFVSQVGLVLYDFRFFDDSLSFQRKGRDLFKECKESSYPARAAVEKS